MLLDTHCHLDFIEDAAEREALVRTLAGDGIRLVAQTMTPSGFRDLLGWLEVAKFPSAMRPIPALGLHPWTLEPETAEADIAAFIDALPRARCLGEIGLDFTPRRLEQAEEQLQASVLRAILTAARDDGAPRFLSIHAVRAVNTALDLLEECGIPGSDVVPVVHWFSGTSDELTRLIRLGGAISVHPAMLATKRGRAYVQQVPGDRLLLETDLPSDGNSTRSELAEHWASSMHEQLETIRALRGEQAHEQLLVNQTMLFGRCR